MLSIYSSRISLYLIREKRSFMMLKIPGLEIVGWVYRWWIEHFEGSCRTSSSPWFCFSCLSRSKCWLWPKRLHVRVFYLTRLHFLFATRIPLSIILRTPLAPNSPSPTPTATPTATPHQQQHISSNINNNNDFTQLRIGQFKIVGWILSHLWALFATTNIPFGPSLNSKHKDEMFSEKTVVIVAKKCLNSNRFYCSVFPGLTPRQHLFSLIFSDTQRYNIISKTTIITSELYT